MMDTDERNQLKKKIALLVPAVFLLLFLFFFGTSGTLGYWEAWVWCGVLLGPFLVVLGYLVRKDPELLARRMRTRERESVQKRIVAVSVPVFVIAFLIPGLDHRYGWSDVPVWGVFAADILVMLGYILVFLVFRENPFTSRVVEVEPGQRVIATGPYAIVRHPMYLGASVMMLATPIALGSYWALPVFCILPVILIYRIRNEEEILGRELPGYREYMQKVRYRLIPGIW